MNEKLSNLNLESKNENDDIEDRARILFLQATEMEKKGKVFDAIRLYRRSMQLVPDIETRIYEMNKAQFKQDEKKLADDKKDCERPCTSNIDGDDDEDLTDVDLLARFKYQLQLAGQICQRASGEKTLITTGAHFCNLPLEIILYIFRWVVSNDLDTRSLDACSRVCKGFFLCARDTELWRAACVKCV